MACMLSFTSCSDDEYVYEAKPEAISIIKSQVLFTAEAQTGTVEFKAPSAVTAEVDKSWCQATVSGNTVNVSVEANNDYEGRMATVTLKCAEGKKEVFVQQNGIVILFGFYDKTVEMASAGGTFAIDAKSTDPYTVESKVSWITATATETGVKITVSKNKSLERTGQVVISSPQHDNLATITIKQEKSDFVPTLAGKYDMTFHTTKAEDATDLQKASVTLRQDASDPNKYWLEGLLAPTGYGIPLRNDVAKQQLVMDNCPVLGKNGDYWVVAVCLYTTATSTGTISYTQNESRAVYFDYVLDEDAGTYRITVHNSAAELINPANVSKGFAVYNFTSDTTFSSSTRASGIVSVRVPILQQVLQ